MTVFVSISKFLQKHKVPVFFLFLYLLFPTNNSSIDGWGYAEEIKNGYNLFRAHHLFYNIFGYILISAINFIGFHPDILAFMKITNAITGFFALIMLNSILKNLSFVFKNPDSVQINNNLWLFFVGSSFGFWRFTIENEVYIIPILLSLIATYYFISFLKENNNKYILYTSFFASLAPLFHQIHIFWWIAIFVGIAIHTKKWNNIFSFIAISLIIPTSYFLVILFIENQNLTLNNITNFILSEYISGNADTTLDYRNFLLSPISFIRSFYQVHGNILLFLKHFPALYIFVTASLLLALKSLFYLKKIKVKPNRSNDILLIVTSLAFILHLLFAIFSHGNAEFMVVLIPLLVIIIEQLFTIPRKVLISIALSMFIWNMSLAIIPNNRLNFNNEIEVAKYIKENSNSIYLLNEKNIVENIFYYKYGYSIEDSIFQLSNKLDYQQLASFQNDSLTIYSDAFSKNRPLSRATIINGFEIDNKIKIVEKGNLVIESFYGNYTLDKIKIME